MGIRESGGRKGEDKIKTRKEKRGCATNTGCADIEQGSDVRKCAGAGVAEENCRRHEWVTHALDELRTARWEQTGGTMR